MKKIILLLLVALTLSAAGYAQDVTGRWGGSLDLGMMKLRLIFDISKSGDLYSATMDSPDQGVAGVPLTSVIFENGQLSITDERMRLKYDAELNGDILNGVFTQPGLNVALDLKRGGEVEVNRPQTPVEPYPYRSEEIAFQNKTAGITLAGTLTIPEGKGKFPAVVLISGSGPQNRDEELMGHRPFLVLSDYLTRHGIAVLRYDDRGTAASQGDYTSATIPDFATDAESAFEYLKSRPEINSKKVGLVGHSEGGLIVYMLGARRSDIAFIIPMAGPTVLGETVVAEQRRLICNGLGMTTEQIAENEAMIEKIMVVVNEHPYEYITAELDRLAGELAGDSTPEMAEMYKKGLIQMISPEMLSLLRYDPTQDIAKVRMPIFAIGGTKDLQVPLSMSIDLLPSKVTKGVKLKTKAYEGLNHLFQHTETGLPTEYGTIEETISPEVLSDMAEWIKSITK